MSQKSAKPSEPSRSSEYSQPSEFSKTSRRIDQLLSAYEETHRNIINRLIHWFCVPVIAWSILALLWSLPFPSSIAVIPGLNWAWIVAALVLLYYLTLSLPLALGLAVLAAAAFMIIGGYLSWGDLPLWQLAIALFLPAWLLQFIGHRIEGRHTPFPKCLQLLAIGPAWMLSQIFRLFQLRY